VVETHTTNKDESLRKLYAGKLFRTVTPQWVTQWQLSKLSQKLFLIKWITWNGWVIMLF